MPYEKEIQILSELRKEIQILSELRGEYSCFDPNEREYYHALSEAIRSLKTVDAEPVRHGRWETYTEHRQTNDGREYLNGWYECSKCRTMYPADYEHSCYKYCPNCGAKMDGETKDEQTV